jgi:hypothetical protein
MACGRDRLRRSLDVTRLATLRAWMIAEGVGMRRGVYGLAH